jgi:LTXXQ motif family protein
MQQHLELCVVASVVHPRLAEIETDLALTGPQVAAWQVFVETYLAIMRTLETINSEVAALCADHRPPLTTALDVKVRVLSARLRATQLLKAITDSFYQSLNQRQRESADRLLPTVCDGLALPTPSMH